MSSTIQNLPVTPSVGRAQNVQPPQSDIAKKPVTSEVPKRPAIADQPASSVELSPQAVESLTRRAPYLVTADPTTLGFNPQDTNILQDLRNTYLGQFAPGTQPEINVGVKPKDTSSQAIRLTEEAQEVLETPPDGQLEDFVDVSETFNPDQLELLEEDPVETPFAADLEEEVALEAELTPQATLQQTSPEPLTVPNENILPPDPTASIEADPVDDPALQAAQADAFTGRNTEIITGDPVSAAPAIRSESPDTQTRIELDAQADIEPAQSNAELDAVAAVRTTNALNVELESSTSSPEILDASAIAESAAATQALPSTLEENATEDRLDALQAQAETSPAVTAQNVQEGISADAKAFERTLQAQESDERPEPEAIQLEQAEVAETNAEDVGV